MPVRLNQRPYIVRVWRHARPRCGQTNANTRTNHTQHTTTQRWASIEDQEDVIEARQLDQAEIVAASLKGLELEGGDSSDRQDEEDDDDENAKDGNVASGAAEPPLSYAELSQYFAPLESYLRLGRGRLLAPEGTDVDD